MKKHIKPVARRTDIVTQETDHEVLVYDLSSNTASCLNETSAFVWQNCNGTNAITDIAQALARKTNTEVNDDLVWLAIDELSRHKLLAETIPVEYSVPGMSRRQLVKSIGMGSLLALPVIASLVAPTAAQNGSCLPIGQLTVGCHCQAPGCPCDSSVASGQFCQPGHVCQGTNMCSA